MQPNTAIHKPQTEYRGISFFIKEKREVKAGIQKNMENMISVAAQLHILHFAKRRLIV
jgi:hypothetical protein